MSVSGDDLCMNPRSLGPSATVVPIGLSPVKRAHANSRNTGTRRGRQGQLGYVGKDQVRAQAGERVRFCLYAAFPPGMEHFEGIGSLVGEDLER